MLPNALDIHPCCSNVLIVSSLLLLNLFISFVRERKHEQGRGRKRGRERIPIRLELSALSPMRDLKSQTVRYDLSWNQELNLYPTEPPRRPNSFLLLSIAPLLWSYHSVLSILLQLKDSFSFLEIMNKTTKKFLYRFWCDHDLSYHFNKYLGWELLGQMVSECLML